MPPAAEERWRHAVASSGPEFDAFWSAYDAGDPGDVLYAMGVGFDPRMCDALQRVRRAKPNARIRCVALMLNYGVGGVGLEPEVAKNLTALRGIVPEADLQFETVPVASGTHPGQSSAKTRQIIQRAINASGAKHVIVDLSATPKSVGLTALLAALQTSDQATDGAALNVHAVVNHNPSMDDAIEQVDVQRDPFLLNGLLEGFDEESAEPPKTVWMPVLGRGRRAEMEAIKNEWHATEVCPVIPSPSRDPRLGDDLVVEHRELIRDERGRAAPRNILRVAEDDPFEAYAQIVATVQEYGRSYKLVGGCRVLLSAHSSKLLSVAALLAAYDARGRNLCRGTSLAVVESRAYKVSDAVPGENLPYTMWLAGAPYR